MAKNEESLEKVVEDMKLSMNATAQYLAFLRNIGKHSFRKSVKMTDVELEKYIQGQDLNIIQMAREHLLAWKWINQTGRLEMFNSYRMKVQGVIKEIDKKALEKITDEQLGPDWKPEIDETESDRADEIK